MSSLVTEARSENFRSIFCAVKPGVLVSTTKPRMTPSSFAQMMATSARLPLVIQRLVPLSTKPVVGALGAGDHPAGVGAEVGLGEAEAADGLAAREAREPATLLLLGAVGVDRVHHQRALHRAERADARVAALELLHHEAVGDVAHARAAVALEVGARARPAAELGDELGGEGAGLVVLRDVGRSRASTKARTLSRTMRSSSVSSSLMS
jgi:hypothetical protein